MTAEHTPVYIKHGYGWIDTSWIDKSMDADSIGRALERYQDKNGKIDGDRVIDDAENDPSHPLHDYLTAESIDEAIRQRRREQLRVVFRSLAIVWRNPHTGDILKDSERAYVALGAGNREQAGKFQMITVSRTVAPTPEPQARTYSVSSVPRRALPEPEVQSQPKLEPVRMAPPPPAAIESVSERHKGGLRALKKWANSYRDVEFFASVVAIVDGYPDPD